MSKICQLCYQKWSDVDYKSDARRLISGLKICKIKRRLMALHLVLLYFSVFCEWSDAIDEDDDEVQRVKVNSDEFQRKLNEIKVNSWSFLGNACKWWKNLNVLFILSSCIWFRSEFLSKKCFYETELIDFQRSI